MQKYCFIKDEETGLVQLGAGCPDEYYKEIGMKKRDVEQSEKDNQWYLKNKCPHYTEAEKTAMRKADFESTFFEIQGFGWFRRNPKGYSSAVESLNTAFNAVSLLGKLSENTLIFYQQPDYTKPEECTEEWLIAHQIYNQEMTAQEFSAFYVGFMTAWNAEEHE